MIKIVQTSLLMLCFSVYVWGQYSGLGPVSIKTPSSATSVQWYKDGTLVAGATNTTHTTSVPGIYHATFTSGVTQCAEDETVKFILLAHGTNVTLNGTTNNSGGTGYQWNNQNGAILGANSATYTTATGGTYYLTYNNGTCLVSSQLYYVFVLPLDSDGDGLPDITDLDDDNDGILDTIENTCSIQNLSKTGVTVSSTLTWTGNLSLLVDGNASTPQVIPDAALISGKTVLQFNFPTATLLTNIELIPYISSTPIVVGSTVDLQGWDGSSWKPIVSNLTVTTPTTSISDPAQLSYKFAMPDNVTSYSKYRIQGLSGSMMGNWAEEAYFLGPCTTAQNDKDGDGIVNSLDLDSDGDGCPDALEGGANLAASTLVTSTLAGGNSGTSYTGTSTSPVVKNLGNTVDANGIPTVAGTGQTVGNSANKLIQSANCPVCIAGTTAPIITQTTASNTCPTATVDLSTMTNTGTKPTGTTLIWSTHNTPSVSGDTLTNLAVSTAGKYYALYYDTLNQCYSPADSVTVTITSCCANPSVGGTATYTGGAVCSTANMGTITLSGQTGDVVKWQTSTNGGTSWTDITNTAYKNSYTFINAANNQQYRAIISTGVVSCADDTSTVVTIATTGACTTNTCSYTSDTFNPTISTSSNPNYTTHIILVNPTDGLIKYATVANSTAFSGVAVGNYIMYVVTYDNTIAPQPTFTVGANISTLVGCLAVSDPLLTKVCCPTIAAPTTTVTQPTCNVSTGTITVTAPTSGVSYSFDNGATYQASTISGALAAGTYQVMVKDSTSGCVSTAASTVINAQPATPAITNVSKTDPSVSSCPAANDGTITVTATGSNLQYSKDNGATWQASNTFSGLVAGSYTIKVRDSISTCEIANATNPVVLTAPVCNQAPVITSAATVTYAENGSGVAYITTATDPNTGQILTFSFETGGADNAQFTINPTTGQVSFITSPNFESPTDSGSDNVYNIKVKVCDNGVPSLCTTKDVAITILPVNESPNIAVIVPVTLLRDSVQTVCTPITDPDAGDTFIATTTCNPKLGIATPSVSAGQVCLNYHSTGTTGKDTVCVKVCDAAGACDTVTFVINILNFTEVCNNQIDDDGDGLIDCEDTADCTSCGCDNTTGDIVFTVSGQNTAVGFTQEYVLTDSTGTILKISSTTSFTGLLSGRYRVYAVNYKTASGISGLTIGQKINAISGACFDVSLPYLYKVCLCVNFNITAILEGSYETSLGKMRTTLNGRGLLPGQTPVGQFAVATPAGHPYKGAPWYYTGTEGDTITTYPSSVVDWVLVTLRTDSATTVNSFRIAGWLHDDGHISFLTPCFEIANGSYFVMVEHRNHVGVMSHQKVNMTAGVLTYDFTARESYVLTNPPSFGEKLKGGKYVLYAGDGKKTTVNTNFDINFNDSQLWKLESGIFDQYRFGDFNMDADVNFADSYLWKLNNGKYSGVPH